MLTTLQASHCLELFFPQVPLGLLCGRRTVGEVRGIGGGDPLGGHSNSPNERGECLAKAVVVGMEKNELIPKIFRAECSALKQAPAIKPFFVATGRDTNFLSCEDGRMPASG